MQYNNSFEFAALILIIIIMGHHITRRPPASYSSRYFLALSVAALCTTVFDILSSYTISYPDQVPLWLNYVVSATYLFFFYACIVIFLLYTDALAKISSIQRIIPIIARIILIYEAIILATGQWTHLSIYFDENKNYCHGILFYVNYVIMFILLITSVGIVLKGRVRFSLLQQLSLVFYAVIILVSVAIQARFPSLLLGGFDEALMILFTFIAFENPAYYSYKDTRCYNRDAFVRVTKYLIKQKRPASMVVAGIKDISMISRRLRAAQRENLYRSLADRLNLSFGKDAFLLGPDSFAIIIPNYSENLSVEHSIEEKLKDIFSKPLNLSDKTQLIQIKTAIIPSDIYFSNEEEVESVIESLLSMESPGADLREDILTAIKNKKRHDDLEHILSRAIEENSFKVFYQPIYEVSSGRFKSAEALIRLIDKDAGFIPPDEFIPFAEASGMILAIGEIVFRKVCAFIKSVDMKALGLSYIEVNLSPIQCAAPGISDYFFSIMKEYDLDPSLINFEITETAEAEFRPGSPIANNILEMNKKGIAFSLDDFGSGFAAMDHLFQLPIDLVKVDKGILWQAMKDKNAMIVLTNTFHMVQELNKHILVEGVETEEMVDVLTANGCHYMQGYYFSKPVPEGEFVEFLKERNQ